jgi:hypothetical protein
MSNKRRRPWWKSPAWWLVIITFVGIVVTIILRPWAPPDFSISVSPMQGEVQRGGVIQTAITVEGINHYKHPVSLTASGHPSDIVVTFVPPFGTAIPTYVSTMTMTVGSNVPIGDYTIVIQGMGADGIEHTCQYTLTVKPSTVSPEPYMVYSDIGIAPGDVQDWSGAEWGLEPPFLVDGSYVIADAPEGTKCFAVTSGSGTDNYVGWGVFLGIFSENHELITAHTVDLSDYENIEFWVKTTINLEVEIQQDNDNGKTSSPRLISNYGWNSGSPDLWQKVTIPKNAFVNMDLTKIFCPFMITGTGSQITFYVDEVMWVP